MMLIGHSDNKVRLTNRDSCSSLAPYFTRTDELFTQKLPSCSCSSPCLLTVTMHSGITLGNVIAEIKQQMWWYFYKPVTCEWKDSSFQLCFRQTANIVLLVPVGCICKLFLNLEESLLEDSFVLISVWCPSVQWPPNTGHQLTPGCCCCCWSYVPSIGIRIRWQYPPLQPGDNIPPCCCWS